MMPAFRDVLERRLLRPAEVMRRHWENPNSGATPDACVYIFVDFCNDALDDFLTYEPLQEEAQEFVAVMKAQADRLSGYLNADEAKAAIDALMDGKTIHDVFTWEKVLRIQKGAA